MPILLGYIEKDVLNLIFNYWTSFIISEELKHALFYRQTEFCLYMYWTCMLKNLTEWKEDAGLLINSDDLLNDSFEGLNWLF